MRLGCQKSPQSCKRASSASRKGGLSLEKTAEQFTTYLVHAIRFRICHIRTRSPHRFDANQDRAACIFAHPLCSRPRPPINPLLEGISTVSVLRYSAFQLVFLAAWHFLQQHGPRVSSPSSLLFLPVLSSHCVVATRLVSWH